jgi:TolB-like protein
LKELERAKQPPKPEYTPAELLAQAAPSHPDEVQKPLPLPDKPSIAVLPFENMSGDPEQEYFCEWDG